jgi:glycerol uptake facilitator-like aquaporin
MFGAVSGGHFNPLVFCGRRTRSAALARTLWRACPVGGWVRWRLNDSEPDVRHVDHHYLSQALGLTGPFLSEVAATSGLIMVIFALSRPVV